MEELKDKLEESKVKKQNKLTRTAKWENSQKTQAMFYNKTSTNYSKWDFFEDETDSEDEKEKEPIVPNNDPAFKAMEADMLDRKKRR